MDRRRFLVQGLAASSACAMPLTILAQGNLAGYVTLRSGNVSGAEFIRAVKEAQSLGKGVLLHPQARIVLHQSLTVGVSLVGSGASIVLKDGASLSFKNPGKNTQIVTGVRFSGLVKFEDSYHQIVSQNTFKSVGSTAVLASNVVNFQLVENKISSQNGHGIYLHSDMETVVKNNEVAIFGEGHFAYLEETKKGVFTGNKFANKTKGLHPSLVVKNTGDVNPQMILENNNLV